MYIATEIIAALPDKERPEYTEGREGYYWAHNLRGDTANATLDIAIRDFELTGYKQRKAVLQDIVNRINQRWSNERITLVLTDIYENVKPALDKTPAILDNVKKAMHNLDIIPKPLIMRGGYDGSVMEGANKQVISSQADSLIKISRIWADFFPANTSNQPI